MYGTTADVLYPLMMETLSQKGSYLFLIRATYCLQLNNMGVSFTEVA